MTPTISPERLEQLQKEAREYAAENRDYFDSDGVPVDEVYLSGRLASENEILKLEAKLADTRTMVLDQQKRYGECCANEKRLEELWRKDNERYFDDQQEIQKLRALIAKKDEALKDAIAYVKGSIEFSYASIGKEYLAKECIKNSSTFKYLNEALALSVEKENGK